MKPIVGNQFRIVKWDTCEWRSLLALIALNFVSYFISAQSLYYENSYNPFISRIDLATQINTVVRNPGTSIGELDMAFNKQGDVFISGEDNSTGPILLIDTMNILGSIEIHRFPEPILGLCIDKDNVFWASGRNNNNNSGLYSYDPALNVEVFHGNIGYFITDLEFYNGELYGIGWEDNWTYDDNILVKIDQANPSKSKIKMRLEMPYAFFSLASFNDSCGSNQLVAPGDGELVFLDPEKDTFNVINIGVNFSPEGAASKTGWMGSISPLRIDSISIISNPCLNFATVNVHSKPGRMGILFSLDNGQFQANAQFNGILPGVHTVNITDNVGCLNTYGPFTIPDLKSDSIFKFEIEPDFCKLNKGVINILYALGTNYLEFSLDGISWQNVPKFENLSEGTYTIFVKFPSGCLDTLHVSLPGYLPLVATYLVTHENCNLKDGTIEVFGNGGVGPYNYGLAQDLIFSSNSTIDSLSSGVYELLVSDSNGCTTQQTVTVGERNPEISLIEIQNPSCSLSNGSINIQVSNAIPPISYSINSGSSQSSSLFNQLFAGTYDILIVDQEGCNLDSTIILNPEDKPPIIQVEISNATCNASNGSMSVHSNQNDLLYSLNGGDFQQDSVYLSLEPGDYKLLTKNVSGCYDSTNISIKQSGRPTFGIVEVVPDHCYQQQGSIVIQNIQGGVGPYEFEIQNSGFQSEPIFDGLLSGIYDLKVKDVSGCYDSMFISVENIENPFVISTIILPAHCNAKDGSVQVEASGEAPLSFSLNQFTSTQGYFDQLGSGLYSLLLEDAFGCSSAYEVFVPDTTSILSDDINITNASCKNTGGAIEIESVGDDVSFTIEEFPGQILYDKIQNLPAGLYHLTIQDINDCLFDTTITVLRDENCHINLSNIFSPNGDQINDEFGFFTAFEFSKWDLTIFDRSGSLVFSSDDTGVAWDGTFKGQKVQSGVYTWYLKYRLLGDDVEQTEFGNVTLLR